VTWLLVENWVYGTSVSKILRSSFDVDAGEMLGTEEKVY